MKFHNKDESKKIDTKKIAYGAKATKEVNRKE
jgi:hypothetical protein